MNAQEKKKVAAALLKAAEVLEASDGSAMRDIAKMYDRNRAIGQMNLDLGEAIGLLQKAQKANDRRDLEQARKLVKKAEQVLKGVR